MLMVNMFRFRCQICSLTLEISGADFFHLHLHFPVTRVHIVELLLA